MEIKNLWQKFKTHKEGTWILGFDDAMRLYRIIEKARPKKILDLGTGIGAGIAVMAQALVDFKVDGHILGVEQYPKCVKIANELIPEELKGYLTIEHRPTDIKTFEEVPFQHFTTYLELEPKHYDLVVIDGPGPEFLTRNNKEYQVKLPNGDFISLIPHLEEGALIYLDERLSTRNAMSTYFSKYLGVLHGDPNYILLERTNKKYEGSEDAAAKMMREIGYNPDR